MKTVQSWDPEADEFVSRKSIGGRTVTIRAGAAFLEENFGGPVVDAFRRGRATPAQLVEVHKAALKALAEDRAFEQDADDFEVLL